MACQSVFCYQLHIMNDMYVNATGRVVIRRLPTLSLVRSPQYHRVGDLSASFPAFVVIWLLQSCH